MRRQRYESLDFWRGVACLSIVVYHACFYQFAAYSSLPVAGRAGAWMLRQLWLGVPVFFVISGYCITATCDSLRNRKRGAAEFFWRRYRRIFPPFWAACVLYSGVMIAFWLLGSAALVTDAIHPIRMPQSLTPIQWIGNLSLTESWRYLLGGGQQAYLLGHSWSLCYEEQFYLICGVTILLAPRRYYTVALLISGVALTFFVWGSRLDGLFLDGRWLLFAAGVLVYWAINCTSAVALKRVGAMLLGGFIILAAVGVLLVKHASAYAQSVEELIAACGFAFALIVLFGFDETISGSRFLEPITSCGRMCYSLYLVHWIIVKPLSHALWIAGVRSWSGTTLVTIPVCVVASVALAFAFHVLVERRFINHPQQLPFVGLFQPVHNVSMRRTAQKTCAPSGVGAKTNVT